MLEKKRQRMMIVLWMMMRQTKEMKKKDRIEVLKKLSPSQHRVACNQITNSISPLDKRLEHRSRRWATLH